MRGPAQSSVAFPADLCTGVLVMGRVTGLSGAPFSLPTPGTAHLDCSVVLATYVLLPRLQTTHCVVPVTELHTHSHPVPPFVEGKLKQN